jgi:deoxynucleoside triphosphate triphosphohydrolase SAMHD1
MTDAKLHRFFDAVHGLCELPAEIVPYIEHPYFLRLKNIAQLGTLKFVHRQATHTRYEHSLGVAYLAYKAAQHLGATTREQFLVALAGAYHDIGHGAFSHSFDSLIKRIQRTDEKKSYAAHEIRSLKIFEQIAHDIDEQYAKNSPYKLLPEEIELVKFFIDPSFYIGHVTQTKKKGRRAQTAAIQLSMDNIPEYTAGIDQLVNNHVCHLDVDKMDYIMRDSMALNLPDDQRTASEDILQMIGRSAVIDHHWVFDAVDEILISKLVLTRSLLFANYYVSPKVAAVDLHMLDILQRVDQKTPLTESAKFESTIDIEK